MQLELLPRLPDDAKFFLEIPLEFAETLREQFTKAEINKRRCVARLPVPPWGRFRLPVVIFPATSRTKMRLVVYIPPKLRKQSYEVTVRQLWEEQELGRATWHLAPNVCKRRKDGGRTGGRFKGD
jgi:serine protease